MDKNSFAEDIDMQFRNYIEVSSQSSPRDPQANETDRLGKIYEHISSITSFRNQSFLEEIVTAIQTPLFFISDSSIIGTFHRINIGERRQKDKSSLIIERPLCEKKYQMQRLLLLMNPLNQYVRIRLSKHFYCDNPKKVGSEEGPEAGIMLPFLKDRTQSICPPVGKLAKCVAFQIKDYYRNLKLELITNIFEFRMKLWGPEKCSHSLLIFTVDVPYFISDNIALTMYKMIEESYYQEINTDHTFQYEICSINIDYLEDAHINEIYRR